MSYYLLTYRVDLGPGEGIHRVREVADGRDIINNLKRYFRDKAEADWYYIRNGETVKSCYSPPKLFELIDPDPDVLARLMEEGTATYDEVISKKKAEQERDRERAKERRREEYEKLKAEFQGGA